MKIVKHIAGGVALVSAIMSGPTALATYLFGGDNASPSFKLAATEPTRTEPTPAAATDSLPSADLTPLVAGILYTTGKAKVDWNGLEVPVENGTYAYVGGETVTLEPGSMGILQLDGGNAVYLCPGASLNLTPQAGGGYKMNLLAGTSRFVCSPQTPFEVQVNETTLSPSPGGAGGSGGGEGRPASYVGEVTAYPKAGCLVCGLQKNLQVNTPGQASGSSASEGHFIDVRPQDREGPQSGSQADGARLTVKQTQIPQQITSTIKAGFNDQAGAGNTSYLCRCQELKRHADELGRRIAKAEEAAETAEPETVTAAADPETVTVTAEATPEIAPELAPPVAPPDAPAVALAEPGAPIPFDPNVLPAPAAGPDGEGPLLVVIPPLVPSAGTGGGARRVRTDAVAESPNLGNVGASVDAA